MSSLLRVEHVTISYNGKPVVQDVSFELKQGEILGIVGESGSGKSTIIKAVMGLLGEEGLVQGRKSYRYEYKRTPQVSWKRDWNGVSGLQICTVSGTKDWGSDT